MLGYTLRQFKDYSKAVVSQQKEYAHEQLVLMRAAQADLKDFKKVEKKLRDG